jgi:SpoIID/LytB domain protein
MITKEPLILVGIYEGEREARGTFHGRFRIGEGDEMEGDFVVRPLDGQCVLEDNPGHQIARGKEIRCRSLFGGTVTLRGVTIGLQFHWERKEDQTFEGNLLFVAGDEGTITAINEVPLEQYLKSVISSEMSAEAPVELLRAHAITSRSWLVAMLEKQKCGKNLGAPSQRSFQTEHELIRWYDREDHTLFDVCADDHCQRYQGITKIISPAATEAIEATRGVFLVYDDQVCDARFYKACGGRTEDFANAWEDVRIPYLTSVSDAATQHPPILTEEEARRWITSSPDAYCNTTDGNILRQILPSFDQETTDFFRWKKEYTKHEFDEILQKKSGLDFGIVVNLVPLQRGPSGRIVRLRIEGTKRTLVVGKELEIRRWFSHSHLYSSAFFVDILRDAAGHPRKYVFTGAGWGHGVGLCQIGAAVMASRGRKAEEIVQHYFPGATLRKLY